MADSLLAFAQSVRVNACRVYNTPRLVFLCGGPSKDASAPGEFQSARDYFFRYIKTKLPAIGTRVRLAENLGRWYDHDTFRDLLEVEEYIAEFAELIIIFVESAGSIAELGAFSALRTVQPKILAVVNKNFREPSFISEGPVRRLQQLDGSSVYKYAWDRSTERLNDPSTLAVFDELCEEIGGLLEARQAGQKKEHSLDLNSHGHAMLMVADLIDIVFASTRTEIQECLKALGRSIDKSTLQKYLFLLKDLKIIEEEYLNGSFYISEGCGPYIAYDFLTGAQVNNRERAKFLIRSKLDGTRARILRRRLASQPLRPEADGVDSNA